MKIRTRWIFTKFQASRRQYSTRLRLSWRRLMTTMTVDKSAATAKVFATPSKDNKADFNTTRLLLRQPNFELMTMKSCLKVDTLGVALTSTRETA